MRETINIVKRIFQDHYKVELDFQWAENLNKNEFLSWNKHQTPFIYFCKFKEIHFPVFDSKKQLNALAVVRPVFRESRILFNEMAGFLKLTVTESLKLNEASCIQDKKEDILKRLAADPRKVIPFKTGNPVNREITVRTLKPARTINFDPIWIVGNNARLNIRVAFSIHELSSNWAFINAREIPDLIWGNPGVWEKFPQMTILISDIESLSCSKVTYLHESLKFIKNLREKPLLIVTSSGSFAEELQTLKPFFGQYDFNEKISTSRQARIIFHQHQNSEGKSYLCQP